MFFLLKIAKKQKGDILQSIRDISKHHTKDFTPNTHKNYKTNSERLYTMTGNQYQELAARTINKSLSDEEKEYHALHGLVGEIGELHSLYQKKYQGHKFDKYHAMSELSDILWFCAEYCTALGLNLSTVMQYNIDKLRARYPEGFSEEKSLNRADGDI